MAVLCTFGTVLVLLLSLPCQATSVIYHITPAKVTDDCGACITLSQLAANAAFLSSNTTLMFLPGSHNLSATLTITDIDRMSIITASNSTAQIACELSTGFSIENVQYTLICNLEFIGCGSNYIKNVTEFVLQDVVFEGKGESGAALELIETTATLIASTFILNTRGMFKGNDSLHSNDFWAGGAIIATHSNITIKNSIFEGNAAEVGGAIYAVNDCIIAIKDTTFVDNQASVQSSTVEESLAMGGVLYQESGSVRITNCIFTNNSAPNFNGGILYSYKSDILIEASGFAENTANYGAVLFSYNGSVSIESSQFDRNTATWGGVIRSSNCDVVIDRSQFSDNRGGIVDSSNSTVTFNDSQFYRNRATRGGVLHVIEHSKVAVAGSEFNSSTAATNGGVFYINASDIAIQGSHFFNNSANSPGEEYEQAGVLISFNSNVQINDSQFYNNSAGYYGGALSCHASSISISDSLFHAHTAVNGGTLALFSSSVTIKAASHFDRGLATYGGVIFAISSNVTITSGSEFSQNTAVDQGGAIYFYIGNLSINNSNFYQNSAVTDGGALYSVEGKVEIEGSIIKHNKALRGGAVNLFNSRTILIGTVLNNNIATRTAGVLHCSSNSDVIVRASTINNNTATWAAGVLFSSSSSVAITGSILNNNTASKAGVLESLNSNVMMDDSQLSGNNSTRGGVLYFSNSNIILRNSQMNLSRANTLNFGQGGVLYSFKSRLGIYESLFWYNTAVKEGGVVYSRNSDVVINGSHFSENVAIIDGGVVHADNCNTTIHDSFFINNHAFGSGGVLYSSNSNITVDVSTFDGNSAMWGGVIDTFANCSVIMEMNQFYGNRVASGGGVLRSGKGNITINNNQFLNNTSDRQGGVLHLVQCQVMIEDSQFTDNRALQGSVLYTIGSNTKVHSLNISDNEANDGTFYLSESTIILSNVTFISNIGSLLAIDTTVNFTSFNEFDNCTTSQISRTNFEEGGALTAFQSMVYFEGTTTFHNNQAQNGGAVHSTESVLNTLGTILISHNMATRYGGGIYLSQSEVFCQPNSSLRLENNTASRQGGGLHAVGSSIKISVIANETLVSVEGNMAERGGGLSFDSNAKLYVLKRVEFKHPVHPVQIIGNSADYGGALYVNDGTNAAGCESPSTECFLQVLAIHLIELPNLNTGGLYISSNSARSSVSSATLFGGLLDRCTVSPLAEVHNKVPDINDANYVYNQSGLDFFYESAVFPPDTITSDPVKICFCLNGYPDCSNLETNLRRVKKGESFTVSLIAVDQVGQPVIASIQSSLNFTQSGLGEGQLFQRVTNNCTDLKFNVFSSKRFEELTLYADGPCKDADLSRRSISIQFLRCTCPIGFQPQKLNDTTCECQCHRTINQYVRNCDDQTGSLVRRVALFYNVWIYYSNTSGYLVYPNCPYDYCKPLSLNTPITLSQPNGSDAQCAFNRVSILCGSCEPGLSLSLGSSRCLSCPHYWPALLVVITLTAVFAGIALVAMLLFLNLTVAVGSLNGIIFYANIVAANRNIFFPYQAEPSFASVFISFLNLDIGIDTCFFESMTTYTKTWLQLIFPFYVILLVVLLIVISSYSDKFSNLIGKKDPVATLATLILLSYARLFGISFIALSAGTLTYADGSHQIVWLPDATISYFGGVHTPLFIVAILIIIVGLVYTVVVFLWQWLLRLPNKQVFAWTRNQKLQIFIETYNVPYTPHHRYWTGMLLLARVILYLIAIVNVSNDPYMALTSITFIIMCILCLKGLTRGRVFKYWSLDLLETFFYFNILFLAIFTWYSLSATNHKVSQTAVINVSVIITVIVLLLIILYHVYSYTPIFLKFRGTKLGKRLDEAFKSISETKTKQRTFETSEDNLLLDMVYRPINTEGYSSHSTGEQHTTSQLQPTQSTVEVPIRKPDSAMEVTDKELDYISPKKANESDHSGVSSDTEKHVADKIKGIQCDEQERHFEVEYSKV